jgi:hypothetical protein
MNKKHISFSEFRLFLSCPFKHYLEKVLKLPQESNEFLIFGSALHASLEEIVLKKPNKILYEKIFAKHFEAETNSITTKGFFGRNFIYQGTSILKELNFFERFKDWEVVCVEEEIYEPLYSDPLHKEEGQEDGVEMHFKGFIDLVLKKDDNYLIIDWKSAFKRWDIEKKKEDKTFWGQLALYKHFYATKHNIPLDKIQVRFVTLARDPVDIQQYSVEISLEYMSSLLLDVTNTAKEILKKEAFPRKAKLTKGDNGFNCKYCSHAKSKFCDENPLQIVKIETKR